MYQIDASGSVTTMPTPGATATPGWFTGGNPANGEPATVLDADWFNALQAEMLAILSAAGIAPSKTADAQILAAIQSLHGSQLFTASGSFTAPFTGTFYFSGCASGGGGAGALSALATGNITAASGGGGAGQPAIRVPLNLTVGQVVPLTFGAPGAGGASGGGAGGAGGNLVVGTLLTLTGGSGGIAGVGGSTSAAWAGGPGGAGFPAGSDGCDVIAAYCGPSGAGASGPFGGGGPARRGAAGNSAAGIAASGYGAGGGGAGGGYAGTTTWVGGAGGAGAPALAMFEW